MNIYLKSFIKYLQRFLTAVFFILLLDFIWTPQSYASTVPASASSSSGKSASKSNTVLSESAMSISKLQNGEDLTMLSIDSIPPALNQDSTLSVFVTYMFYFLFAAGIVLSFFEGYRAELTGASFSYYGLFLRTSLIAIGFLSWKQEGSSNFAQLILTLADKTQLYLIKQNINGIGQSVSQIVSSISGSLHSVSIPTVSSNGTASVQKGWNLNPVSWLAGAMHAITGAVLMGIIWFLFNILYLVIQLFMALVQLVFLGLLFAICPIILGFEAIPYTRGVFGKWMKMFIEISFWGVMVALEQLIFFTILGKMESINLPSSGTGIGNILGMFTFAEVITVFIIMMVINVSVPFLAAKLFDGISGEAHEKMKAAKGKLISSAASAGAGTAGS
ncbi:MAG: type IV secretion system protein [bacterium]